MVSLNFIQTFFDLSQNLKFHYELNSGDEAGVEKLLKSGLDVNHKDKHGQTALHIATLEGNRLICLCI